MGCAVVPLCPTFSHPQIIAKGNLQTPPFCQGSEELQNIFRSSGPRLLLLLPEATFYLV